MEKKVAPVMTVEAEIAAGAPAMKGSSGTAPQSTKARKVMSAARTGERVDRRQPVLLGHHGVDPALARSR